MNQTKIPLLVEVAFWWGAWESPNKRDKGVVCSMVIRTTGGG